MGVTVVRLDHGPAPVRVRGNGALAGDEVKDLMGASDYPALSAIR